MSSSLVLPETVRFYIERSPGNVLVPLIPVDQLLFQPQGVPLHLSKQQISEGNWQRVTGVTEAAFILPGQISSSVTLTPTHRAPDFDVTHGAAESFSKPCKEPKLCPYPVHSTSKREKEPSQNSPSVSNNVETSPSAHRSRAPITETRINRRELTTCVSESHMKGNNRSISVRSVPLPHVSKHVDASRDDSAESHVDATSSCSRVDREQFASISSKDEHPRLPSVRVVPSRSNWRAKIYCTHWIQTGECAWGKEMCKYKHEMPPIDILKKETGFNSIPRWYKEQTAILNHRGPTWLERSLQARKQVSIHGNGLDLPGPREFPDPCSLRNTRRGDANQEERSGTAAPNLIDLDQPTGPANSNPMETRETSATLISVPTVSATSVDKKRSAMNTLRRNSQSSCSSSTTENCSPIDKTSKPKYHPQEAKRYRASQPKSGLKISIHAPAENETAITKLQRTTNATS